MSEISIKEKLVDILDRLIIKITSGRFIFTIIVALVYAFLACNGQLDENRIHEITLVVLYAYFSRPRGESKPKELEAPKELEEPKED